jgi:hypothetical protein
VDKKLNTIIDSGAYCGKTIGEYLYGDKYKMFKLRGDEEIPPEDSVILTGPNTGRSVGSMIEELTK